MAFVDYFLKVEGLAGTSTDVQHKDEFEIKDFSFGVENPTTIGSATGGAGAGKIKFNEFTITKTTDKASPLFFKNCCAGAHYKKVTLTARKAGGENERQDFLKIALSDVVTSSYRNGGRSVTRPPIQIGDVVSVPGDTVGGDTDVEDAIAFQFASAQLQEGRLQHIDVTPAATGQLALNTATGDFTVTETSNGTGRAGNDALTDGLLIIRYLNEYDVSDFQSLLNAPFNTGSLTLGVTEVREAATPGDDPGSDSGGPTPHMHFDVVMYTPADLALTLEDLTRSGKRIGSLHLDPRRDPASLELDLTDAIREAALETVGIRLQLRGKPLKLPDPNATGIPNEVLFDTSESDEAELNDGEGGNGGNGRDRSATFRVQLAFDTQ